MVGVGHDDGHEFAAFLNLMLAPPRDEVAPGSPGDEEHGPWMPPPCVGTASARGRPTRTAAAFAQARGHPLRPCMASARNRRWLAWAPPWLRCGGLCPSCRWSSGRDGGEDQELDRRRGEAWGRAVAFLVPCPLRILPLDLACSSCTCFAEFPVSAIRGEGAALDVRAQPKPARR